MFAKVRKGDVRILLGSTQKMGAGTNVQNKLIALHFANEIWKNPLAEVMGHTGTAQENFDLVVAFAASIRMIPVKVLKEQPGYLLNSMLVPFLSAAEGLWAGGVGSPEDIDRAWMIGTGAPAGPFRILDIIGLTTAYNVGMLNPKAQQEGTIENRMNWQPDGMAVNSAKIYVIYEAFIPGPIHP